MVEPFARAVCRHVQVMKQVVCPVLTSLSTSTRICASGVLDIYNAGSTQAGVAGLSHELSVLLLQDIDELRSWAYMAFLACPGAQLHGARTASWRRRQAAGQGETVLAAMPRPTVAQQQSVNDFNVMPLPMTRHRES
jgi:hypothetical protein